MALFTIYLSHLTHNKHLLRSLKNPQIYYVMRNRGNNEVAPHKELLDNAKKGKISWAQYVIDYLEQIQFTKEAHEWIENVAFEAIEQDVILVCFEKDHTHCHRTLLAQEIVRQNPEVVLVGELRNVAREA